MKGQGGYYLYRATAECTVCGRVVDVGPFDNMTATVNDQLPGWILATDLRWQIRDGMGTPITVCDLCAQRPFKDLVHDVAEARGTTNT